MSRFIPIVVIFGLLFGGGYYASKYKSPEKEIVYKTVYEKDEYVRFSMEAYDLILANYWAPKERYSLPTFFKLALERVEPLKTQTLASSTREGTAEMLSLAFSSATTSEQKKTLTLNTLMVVLYNLEPVGRNGILSTVEETALRQNVANINPEKDLYKDIGVEKTAPKEEIEKVVAKKVEEKVEELKKATTTEAKKEVEAQIEKVNYVKKVLTNPDNRAMYDQNQVEPTVFSTKLGNTLYLYISKISPSTLFEFAKAVDNASTTKGYDSMIMDVRGNVGGSLDFVQHFMGLWNGLNQYAFDLYRQGKYEVQRTVQPKFPELGRFKEVAIITDGMTQSTAEVISSTFKRLRMGKTVGTRTRGWGTVENTYPITTVIDPKTKYTLLLVNNLTTRDDNEPIETRGVDPDISTESKDWQSKLSKEFRSTSLIKALKDHATNPPIK